MSGLLSLQPRLQGATLDLRPLHADDFDALYAAASDPLVWAQHPQPDRYQRPVFEQFFAGAMASQGALVVIDRAGGQVIGSSRYYDLDVTQHEVAIGYTFLARAYWGGVANRELKQLMLDYAFRWARVVWFHVGPDNLRSQKALGKIGIRFSHRGQKDMFGKPQDYNFYRISAAEWAERSKQVN